MLFSLGIFLNGNNLAKPLVDNTPCEEIAIAGAGCKFLFSQIQLNFFFFFYLSKYGVFSGPYFPAFGLRISPYSVRMRENRDWKKTLQGYDQKRKRNRKNSVFGHVSRSE